MVNGGTFLNVTRVAVLFLGAYLAATWVGLYLHGEYGGLTPLWPASAIGLLLLHKLGRGWFPLIVLGECLVALWLAQPLTMGFAGGLLQALEGLIAVTMLRRIDGARPFQHVHQALQFCVYVCLLPPVLSAVGGALAQLAHGLVGAGNLPSATLTWWLGDAMALLILTPFFLTWWPLPAWSRRTWLEWTLISALLLATGLALTTLPEGRADLLFFLLLPFVGWLALRFRADGASSAAVVLAGVVFGLHSAEDGFATAVHIAFVGVAAMAGYVLAALLSRRDAVLAALRHQADHDAITGLYNRARLERALHQLHESENRGDATHALLHVDLDHFKLVNDSCGHERADELLGRLGRSIQRALPADVLLGRLGGDEFLVLAPGQGPRATALAEELRVAILAFAFDCGQRSFSLGASIGVATFGAGEVPAAVMSRADMARHAAKSEGGNRVHVLTGADLSVQRHRSELEWATDFEHALRRGDLTLFAQQIAPTGRGANGRYYEVLLRKYENGVPTSPAQFLPGASRYGLMPMIDRWVIARCFECLAHSAPEDLTLSINLAAETLDRPDFLEVIEALQDRHDIDPARICFEVTERVAVHNLARTVETMRRLAELGFRFALDDFGAGVANFGYLNQLPVQFIKIDGQFIRDIVNDESSRVIVACVRDLARIHGLHCIAEFVETQSILDAVTDMGIDYGQGFHIHRPEPLQALLKEDTRDARSPAR